MVEHDTWEKEKDLENAREVVEKFERRMSAKVRKQENLDIMEEKDFRRRKLPGKHTVKMMESLKRNIYGSWRGTSENGSQFL